MHLRHRSRTPPTRTRAASQAQRPDQRLSTTADARADPLHVVLGRRLLLGRSVELLRKLQDTRLFNFFDDDKDQAMTGDARRGTVVQRNGKKFFVLDTFCRYKVQTADVAELEQHSCNEFRMGKVTSLPVREFSDVEAARVELAADRAVKVFTAPEDDLELPGTGALDIVSAVLRHLQHDLQQTKCQQTLPSATPEILFPQAAKAHQEFAKANGEHHSIIQMHRNCQPSFVLDMPFPREFLAPSWRCSTCHHKGHEGPMWIAEVGTN